MSHLDRGRLLRTTVAVVAVWAASVFSVAAVPVRVVPERSVRNPSQPQAAVDENGTIYVAYGADETVYCSKSTDRGRTFGVPAKVAAVRGLALGSRRGPRIVASREAVIVTAVSHDSGHLLAWRSSDGGRRWSKPVPVNDSPNSAREGLHAMALSPSGEVFCAWLDLRNGKTELFGAASTDGGKIWDENRLIYRSPSGSICECCHPAVTFDTKGKLYVMWRNSLGGFRDMFGTVSSDRNQPFGAAKKLGTGSWKLDGCPMDGGYLATTTPGEVTTVWRRDKSVFRTDSCRRDEQPLGDGEQPWVAGTSRGAYIVWTSRRNGDLWLSDPTANHPERLAGQAADPVVAAPSTANGPVVVVWETGSQRATSIMSAVIANDD